MNGEKVELTIRGDVERMTLGPDDFIVVTIDEPVPESTSENIQKELASCVGVETSRVIVASGGIKLSVTDNADERMIAMILIEDGPSDGTRTHAGSVIDECETLSPRKIKTVRVSDPFEVGIQVGETIIGFRGRNGVYIAIQSGLISYSFASSRS